MRPPIFVLGILPRSGTNHLWDLLSLHPDVDIPSPVWEDGIVAHADHLARYVDDMHSFFASHPQWGVHETLRDELWPSIGTGLQGWLAAHTAPDHRILTKMPSVRNMQLLPRLFPSASMVVLVRDGKDVVESCVRTFGWTYERAMRQWARAARTIVDFEAWAAAAGFTGMRRVSYEQLVADEAGTIGSLLDFAGLPRDTYDFTLIEKLPIRGSSVVRGVQGDVTWKPLDKPAKIDTVDRTAGWDVRLHRRYDWLAGDMAEAVGYGRDRVRRSFDAGQAALDLRWSLTARGKQVSRAVRRQRTS